MDGELGASNPQPAARRRVHAVNIAGVAAAIVHEDRPVFEWVDPRELLIDESYQRALSERSFALIRKIVGGWDWRKFKPPIVARSQNGLEVIDGQHTAIAAVSHPDIHEIPIMIVEAEAHADRAKAFIGHNRDRLNITPMQMHFAAAAAGDEDALTINQVCTRAGVRILRSPPANGAYKPSDCVALKAIGGIIGRRGAMRAREILQILVAANCAPITAGEIRAVELLMFDRSYAGEVAADAITSAVISLRAEGDGEVHTFAKAHGVPVWRALAAVLFRRSRRGRRRQD